MKTSAKKSRFTFYLWVGLAWFLIWEISNLVNFPEEFFPRSVNELWRVSYIVVVNILFLEQTAHAASLRIGVR